ncbi:MAG TPA: tautomerase family protein [Candidatus Acidoferrum sp.]|nr:tautomerase family protein [Candidatus Acidoferrum sp.]
MPLVRISLREGTSPEYRKAIGEGVHRAMIESLAIPPEDCFQVITQHPPDGLIYDPQYLDVKRTEGVVFVQITLSFGRKPQQKRLLYKRMAEILGQNPGVLPGDLLINLVEVNWENWSFGNGDAQYMDT